MNFKVFCIKSLITINWHYEKTSSCAYSLQMEGLNCYFCMCLSQHDRHFVDLKLLNNAIKF